MFESVPDIDSLEPLTVEDENCLREVRQVLERHNRLGRFGINLLHTHFLVTDDEMLVEECDPTNRILVIKPMKLADLADIKMVETNWILTNGAPLLRCKQLCAKSDTSDKHRKIHKEMPDPSD